MTDALFLPATDMIKVNDKPEKRDEAVTKGEVISKLPPIYPESANFRHVSGTVNLNGIIGTDGHINTLTLLSTPDSDLAIAAIAAVRKWVYKPYLLNGEPTSVDTTITVNFSFSR